MAFREGIVIVIADQYYRRRLLLYRFQGIRRNVRAAIDEKHIRRKLSSCPEQITVQLSNDRADEESVLDPLADPVNESLVRLEVIVPAEFGYLVPELLERLEHRRFVQFGVPVSDYLTVSGTFQR